MKDDQGVVTRLNERKEGDSDPLIAIDLSGKRSEVWAKRQPRFHQRILNSVKRLFGGDIPASATANDDFKEAMDDLAQSAKQRLKGPQITNLEKQVSIQAKYAEIKEREANARKTSLEADMLEIEIEAQRVLNSQHVIDVLIQRGDLIVDEREGETVFIYNKK